MANTRIPQSVTIRVPLKAFLSSDHLSDATGKTIAVVISKNGAAFGNPSAGATNATEIGNGWYYVDLSTTDTGTKGPLLIRGTAATIDNSECTFEVADAHNMGFDGVPGVTAGASGGLPLAVDASGRVDVLKINGTSQTARDLGASVLLSSGTGTGQLDFTSGVVKGNLAQILGTALTETAGLIAAGFKQFFNISSPTSTMNTLTTVTTATNLTNAPTAGDFTATMKTSLNAATPASVVGAVGSVTGNVGGNVTGSVGSVTADVGITQGAADKVWLSASRTLSSFGSLVADIATAVWAAGTRTLSAFGFTPSLDSAYDAAKTAAQAGDIPTAIQNADALLKRDMSTVTGEASRSPLNGFRSLVNRVRNAAGTLTIYKEDDSTPALTAAVTTTPTADPIVEIDPT